MNQKRQRGFIGPMEIIEDVQSRLSLSSTRSNLRKALEEIAALLRHRQFQGFWNVRKNSPETRSDLGQFGRIVSHLQTEVIRARRLSQAAFNDLDEWEIGKRFVSFVTVPDQASETNLRCVLRHLHRQPGFTHPGSARQHDD